VNEKIKKLATLMGQMKALEHMLNYVALYSWQKQLINSDIIDVQLQINELECETLAHYDAEALIDTPDLTQEAREAAIRYQKRHRH
jgi:hypothetical protein